MDPPVSEPRLTGTSPAASAAPEPDDEPPVKCAVFHGLRAGGQGRSNEGPPCANSCVESLPVSTAPAALSFAAAVESFNGTRSMHTRECPDVSTPAVS